MTICERHLGVNLDWTASEFFDLNGFPGRLVSIPRAGLLHAGGEPDLIGLVGLHVHPGHLDPYQNLRLHPFDAGEFPSRQGRLDPIRVPDD